MKMRLAFYLVAALAVLGAGVGAASSGSGSTVHLRGTAYEFNNVHTLLAGASIRVAEFPKLKARVGRDGRYDLAVPDRARVTPYIVAPGYHTIYLQTFTTAGEDLANVNFQTPTDAVYRALVALLRVRVDAHGNPVRCAIVSTFNTRNVRDLSFAGFIGYGAHGVAGATARAVPALAKPTYFNKNVVPDSTQTVSSVDGGVVWTGVPTGVYTISAQHPTSHFASFVATCRPGRVVNANPPWGLHELGLANPARVAATWSARGAQTLVTSLRLTQLPPHASVTVRCLGAGCPLRSRRLAPHGAQLDVRRGLGLTALAGGEVLDVAVSAHTFNGVLWRWAIMRGRTPARTTLCVPLGNTLALRRCPST